MSRIRFVLVVTLALAATFAAGAAPAAGASDLVLILDASGSMWGQVGDEAKIAGARRVLGTLIDGLEAGRPVGLIAYGHRREADCADIEQVAPLAPVDATVAVRGAAGAVASGRTYDQPANNPKSFVLPPGEYTVEINEIKGEKRTVTVAVGAGETVERTVDLDPP